MTTPPAGTVRFVKLLAFWPFNVEANSVPSDLKRSTRTVMLLVPVFTRTTSVAHLPPDANCRSRMAPGPPIPVEMTGKAELTSERLVTGNVLKFELRNRSPIIATGSGEELSTRVPVKSDGTEDWLANSSFTNLDIC